VSREWYRWFYSLYDIVGTGTGIIPVTSGGTGLSNIPTNGQLLIGNGTGYTLNTLTASSGITVTNALGTITVANSGVLSFSGGSTGLTPATATTGAVTLAGTLGIANGGTGLTTLTTGYIPFGNGTSAFGSNSNLFWNSANNRLGVGTSSPTAPLSVSISSTANSPTLTIANIDTTSAGVVRANFLSADDGTVGRTRAVIESASDSANNGRLSFYTRNAGTLIERIRFTGTGGVSFGSSGTAYGTSGQVLTSSGNAPPTWVTPTTGTVTSVSFTGGLITVATATTTPALTVAGTSGGVVYFSSASTWASSAVLDANALVVGGGAAVAPSTITTGTGVVTALGVNTGSAGAFVVNGGALGTPSSGTVTNLTGTASININGTVGATTANTGAFTSLSYTTTLTGGTGIIAIGTNQFYKDASGNVGLGTASPGATLDVVAGLIRRYTATASASAAEGLRLEMSGNNAAGRGYYLSFYGPNGSSTSRETARIGGLVNASANTGGYLSFETVSGATGTNAEQMRITSAGNVIVIGAGGLGYGTGSGGTVTQGTSRTTGVTLNKTNGAITMFSAAGSVVAATFTVTNSTVAATDTIILNQKSGTNLYVLLVTAVAAGSFNVTFYTTGGVATDAPVINFSVIKAVTA
jgi:hypothetical protein